MQGLKQLNNIELFLINFFFIFAFPSKSVLYAVGISYIGYRYIWNNLVLLP